MDSKALEKMMRSVISEIGIGYSKPVVYDTAWVARIPDFTDNTKPSFPKSVEWIRNHQLSDGSWGSNQPFYSHANTLSTLSAIIALKQWNNEEDIPRINSGIQALNIMFEKLKDESHEKSVGFEMLFPSLLKTCQRMGLNIEFKDIEKYNERRNTKLIKIKEYQRKYGFLTKHSFWHSLEMFDSSDDIQLDFDFSQIIEENECICGSPSATAFALIDSRIHRNKDNIKAFNTLKSIYEFNNGGIPVVSEIECFELCWSIGFFVMANMSPMDPILKPAIDKLYNYWISWKGVMRGGSTLPPDADDTAVSLYVLRSANILSSVESTETLLKFFRNSHMITYESELFASISTNIHSLLALKLFIDSPKIKQIVSKIVLWLESKSSNDKYIFEDKWHFSPYYVISRAVFALEGIHDSMALKCVNQLIAQQKSDKGWGVGRNSTLEDTSI